MVRGEASAWLTLNYIWFHGPKFDLPTDRRGPLQKGVRLAQSGLPKFPCLLSSQYLICVSLPS